MTQKYPPAATWVHPRPQHLILKPEQPDLDAAALGTVQERLAPDAAPHPQGYALAVTPDGVTLAGHDEAGLFYGRQTLDQLRATFGRGPVPCFEINDWPDLPVRGFMLDISRDRVPTMDRLFRLIDQLASLKINQFQIYTEHTIAYAGHDTVWQDASPLTFDEYRQLEAYARHRFIDLVPCQNLFGHMHRWLTKPAYAALADCPDGWDTPWGYRDPEPCSLNPDDPESIKLSRDLIDQLAAHSDSALFNVGCDETLDLGQGKSRARVERDGRAAVYLDYLQKLCQRVIERGKTPMFWGDIALEHPEMIPRLPADAVMLNWGYEAGHPFAQQSKLLADAGVCFYVCPGTSTWCNLTGRKQNAVDNLREAAESAIEFGAEGYLITDWGDYGHWQPFALSWLGLAYGAGVAWCLDKNRDEEYLSAVISRLAADANGSELGEALCVLGDVGSTGDTKIVNGHWWFQILRTPEAGLHQSVLDQITPEETSQLLKALGVAKSKLTVYQPTNALGELTQAQLVWCADLSSWTVRRFAGAKGWDTPAATDQEFHDLLDRFSQLWRADSRPGGLPDSRAKLERILSFQAFRPTTRRDFVNQP